VLLVLDAPEMIVQVLDALRAEAGVHQAVAHKIGNVFEEDLASSLCHDGTALGGQRHLHKQNFDEIEKKFNRATTLLK
jgi:hypothetical protein